MQSVEHPVTQSRAQTALQLPLQLPPQPPAHCLEQLFRHCWVHPPWHPLWHPLLQEPVQLVEQPFWHVPVQDVVHNPVQEPPHPDGVIEDESVNAWRLWGINMHPRIGSIAFAAFLKNCLRF